VVVLKRKEVILFDSSKIACKNIWKEELTVACRPNNNCYASSCRQIPNLPLSFSNCLASKAFVKISAVCSSVST
jgi:hypothetical protein